MVFAPQIVHASPQTGANIAAGLTPHAPIHIDGNGDFTTENGVSAGSGTGSDPYVIEGWDIDTSSSRGIDVRNTDAYFVIRNVYIHSQGISVGVNIYNAANAEVSGNTLLNNSIIFGVSLNFLVARNTVQQGNYSPIIIGRSFDFSIVANMVQQGNYQDAIIVDQSNSFQIAGNQIINDNSRGIVITNSFSLSITDNYVHPQVYGAVGFRGIYISSPLHSSTGLLISRNTLGGQIVGISLIGVEGSTISNNTILGGSIYGAVMTDSGYITLIGNYFSFPRAGLFLNHTRNMLVYHNNFFGRAPATDLQGSNNSWDNGYPDGGNYYSIYRAVDNCSGPNQDVCTGPDGIADTPYLFENNQDNYPFTYPVQKAIQVLSNDPKSPDWTVLYPTWTMVNGYLDGAGVSAQIISTASFPSDRTVQDRAKTIASGDAPWKTAYLIGKYVDFYDKVTLLLQTDGTIIVQVWQGSTNHNYVSFNSGLSPYDWHTFALAFMGNTVFAYVDGTLYISATDPIFGALGACQVSLASWGTSESQFDRVMIS
jgi:parallel beta-helix repeat protein